MAGNGASTGIAVSASAAAMPLTARQVAVLRLAGRGLSGKQIARHLGISVRTVEGHFSSMRQRTGAHSQGELIAYGAAAGVVKPRLPVPESVISGTAAMHARSGGETRPENQSRNGVPPDQLRDGMRDDQLVSIPSAYDNSVRIGYARVSTRTQDHQAQLGALAAAHCREVVIETSSTRDARPKLHATLAALHAGDTLVIYKPDRVARSMKELLVLLEDQLHARGINLHILTGICAGMHRPDGNTIADKMLFMVAAMAAEMECDLIRGRTLDGLRAAQGQGRRGGRPAAVNDDILAIARARRERASRSPPSPTTSASAAPPSTAPWTSGTTAPHHSAEDQPGYLAAHRSYRTSRPRGELAVAVSRRAVRRPTSEPPWAVTRRRAAR
jgi:DNA invertase Pin-like site-specific DNA recombinase/DNA-binding CsgD family transcriptional regulator